MSTTFSFARLPNESWGVMAKNMNGPHDGYAGETITVTKRNGEVSRDVKLGGIVERRSYATIYATVRERQPQPDEARGPQIPEGRYAIDVEGTILFYKVNYGKSDTRWAGFTFLDRESSENRIPIKDRDEKGAILRAIGFDIAGASSLYGRMTGKCGFCHTQLTDNDSLAAGMGPDCAKHRGIDRKPLIEAGRALMAQDDHLMVGVL